MDSTLLSSLSLHLLSGVQIALHQPAAAGPGSGPVTAALIGAAAAVSGILIKDLGLATEAARQAHQPVVLGAVAQQLYQAMSLSGEGGNDFSAIINSYRKPL